MKMLKNFSYFVKVIYFFIHFSNCERDGLVYLNECTENNEDLNLIKENKLVSSNIIITKDLVYTEEEVTFGLKKFTSRSEWCSNGYFQEVLGGTKKQNSLKSNISHSVNTSSDIGHSENDEAPIINVKKYFLKSGLLRIDKEYYRPEDYCIFPKSESNEIKVNVCRFNCSKNEPLKPCIKKCCSVGTSLNIFEQNCAKTGNNSWSPHFYRDKYHKESEEDLKAIKPHFVLNSPSCGTFINDEGEEEDEPYHIFSSFKLFNDSDRLKWRAISDGSIWYNKGNLGWTKLDTENYCVDGMMNFGHGTEFEDIESHQALLVCPDALKRPSAQISNLYMTTLFISSFFLLLTAIVYVSLWDLQNVHGWTILSQVTSMLFMYIFLGSSYVLSKILSSGEHNGLCQSVGVLAHFFFLSTFCWLTVTNFDLFWTFRSLSPVGSGKSKGLKRYLSYLAFAITVPVTVIITALTLQEIYGDDIDSEVIIPRYGVSICFLDVTAQGYYLYYIIGALLSCNLILITITSLTIYKYKQSTKAINHSKSSKNHKSFTLFLKLFVVMGVTWIFELISWAANDNVRGHVAWYWVPFDMINILQAVGIFAVFVCKRRILNQLRSKYPFLETLIKPVSSCMSRLERLRSGRSTDEIESPTLGTTLTSLSTSKLNMVDTCNTHQRKNAN